jgi:hypothetical protein
MSYIDNVEVYNGSKKSIVYQYDEPKKGYIQLIHTEKINTLELKMFYKKLNPNKGEATEILYSIIKSLKEDDVINNKTKFILRTVINPSSKLIQLYNKLSFEKYKEEQYKSDTIDIIVCMKTTIKKFLYKK